MEQFNEGAHMYRGNRLFIAFLSSFSIVPNGNEHDEMIMKPDFIRICKIKNYFSNKNKTIFFKDRRIIRLLPV